MATKTIWDPLFGVYLPEGVHRDVVDKLAEKLFNNANADIDLTWERALPHELKGYRATAARMLRVVAENPDLFRPLIGGDRAQAD